MREDGSEFDKDLSQIIQLDDIKGDLHMHTTYSDGAFSIRDMAEANIANISISMPEYISISSYSLFNCLISSFWRSKRSTCNY
jgi:hypothetical protein